MLRFGPDMTAENHVGPESPHSSVLLVIPTDWNFGIRTEVDHMKSASGVLRRSIRGVLDLPHEASTLSRRLFQSAPWNLRLFLKCMLTESVTWLRSLPSELAKRALHVRHSRAYIQNRYHEVARESDFSLSRRLVGESLTLETFLRPMHSRKRYSFILLLVLCAALGYMAGLLQFRNGFNGLTS